MRALVHFAFAAGVCAVVTSAALLATKDFQDFTWTVTTKWVAALLCGCLMVGYTLWEGLMESKTLLVDFHCYKIPERLKMSSKKLFEAGRTTGLIGPRGLYTEEMWDFQEKVVSVSGIGDRTGAPQAMHGIMRGKVDVTYAMALEESETILFEVVEELLKKTNTSPKEIGIVIVSCGCFSPQPSMAAMLVNKFKLPSDVLTFNLSSMGCSSSLLCIDLAARLLRSKPNTLALMVAHENMTHSWYRGTEKSMAVANCLFRMGGVAVLLSNRPKDRRVAKYQLSTALRTHIGSQDIAFNCMAKKQDAQGNMGVYLNKTIVQVAEMALRTHLTAFAPLVLPYQELVRSALDSAYVPRFRDAFDHYLLHTGGKAVVNGLQKSLYLSDEQLQHTRDTLYRFGNTSSSSTWYVMACLESRQGVRKGEKLWQLGE